MLPMGQQARLGGDTLSRFLVQLAPRARRWPGLAELEQDQQHTLQSASAIAIR